MPDIFRNHELSDVELQLCDAEIRNYAASMAVQCETFRQYTRKKSSGLALPEDFDIEACDGFACCYLTVARMRNGPSV